MITLAVTFVSGKYNVMVLVSTTVDIGVPGVDVVNNVRIALATVAAAGDDVDLAVRLVSVVVVALDGATVVNVVWKTVVSVTNVSPPRSVGLQLPVLRPGICGI